MRFASAMRLALSPGLRGLRGRGRGCVGRFFAARCGRHRHDRRRHRRHRLRQRDGQRDRRRRGSRRRHGRLVERPAGFDSAAIGSAAGHASGTRAAVREAEAEAAPPSGTADAGWRRRPERLVPAVESAAAAGAAARRSTGSRAARARPAGTRSSPAPAPGRSAAAGRARRTAGPPRRSRPAPRTDSEHVSRSSFYVERSPLIGGPRREATAIPAPKTLHHLRGARRQQHFPRFRLPHVRRSPTPRPRARAGRPLGPEPFRQGFRASWTTAVRARCARPSLRPLRNAASIASAFAPRRLSRPLGCWPLGRPPSQGSRTNRSSLARPRAAWRAGLTPAAAHSRPGRGRSAAAAPASLPDAPPARARSRRARRRAPAPAVPRRPLGHAPIAATVSPRARAGSGPGTSSSTTSARGVSAATARPEGSGRIRRA